MKDVILCIDDEPVILDILRRVLESEGYDVITATSAEEALNISRDVNRKINLVITDIVMPGMNGIQFIEEFQKIRPEVEIIGMSAYATEATIEKMEKMEVFEFIKKPFNVHQLLEVVEKGLKSRKTVRIRNNIKESAKKKIKRSRLLVVDDFEDFRELVRDILEPEGFIVDTASSGSEAIEKIYVGTYDIVLLDIMMTGIDGIETCKKIKEYDPHLFVVMITGEADSEKIKEGELLSDAPCLRKPIDLEEFRRIMREFDYEARRKKRELERIEKAKELLASQGIFTRIKDWILFKMYEYHLTFSTLAIVIVLSIVGGIVSNIIFGIIINIKEEKETSHILRPIIDRKDIKEIKDYLRRDELREISPRR